MFTDILLFHLGGKHCAVAVSDRFESQISYSRSSGLRLDPDKDFGGGFCCLWFAGLSPKVVRIWVCHLLVLEGSIWLR